MLVCEYARNIDPTTEAAQRIDVIAKTWNVAGSRFARNVTPPRKRIHPNNQRHAFSVGWDHDWMRFHSLSNALAVGQLASAREQLLIAGADELPSAAYQRILMLELAALRQGYPLVA